METPLDGCITRAAFRGTREAIKGEELSNDSLIASWKWHILFPDTRPDIPLGLIAVSRGGK
jgi:hypothetical protein